MQIKCKAGCSGSVEETCVISRREKTKGVLVARNITDTALKELRKANLEFKPLEAIEYGVHERTS